MVELFCITLQAFSYGKVALMTEFSIHTSQPLKILILLQNLSQVVYYMAHIITELKELLPASDGRTTPGRGGRTTAGVARMRVARADS